MYNKEPANTYDINKADVYSNGLVMLSAGLLDNVDDIYGHEDVTRRKILEKLTRLKERYPENVLLLSTVDRMLDYNPNTRPSFLKIKKILPEYTVVKDYFNTYPDTPATDKMINHIPDT
jgi:serine/threonine protein kinase